MPSVSAPITQLCKMHEDLLVVSPVKYNACLLPGLKAVNCAFPTTQNRLLEESPLHREGVATPLKGRS